MKNLLIYANCHGEILKLMFEHNNITCSNYNINYITNYETLHNTTMIEKHKLLFNSCDIFIYQHLNNSYNDSPYDIHNILRIINPECKIIKINYYRFKGFWYNNSYLPFKHKHFSNYHNYGLHEDFTNYNTDNIGDIINKLNNINIDLLAYAKYFKESLEKLKELDSNSDIKMYDFFINNFQKKLLFNDYQHPTLYFFYEMFRQLIKQIENIDITVEDENFIRLLESADLTEWAIPILPIIRKILKLNIPEKQYIFSNSVQGFTAYLSVYEYYGIRLSEENYNTFCLINEI